ncbi:MAG: aldo/keto reductase [Propionibacteriaceae bacterium]|jgi:aryl-alcohol dehydrogenase-like predicted oxidoreductase|nr:aldo/keto reductase [Propionibacteriaceae bacterium]
MSNDVVAKRRLGRSGLEVSAWGLGTWALGGEVVNAEGIPGGYGDVDDAESEKGLYAAVEAGVDFIDTADIYGMGHSEEMLRGVLRDHPEVLVATKVGNSFDIGSRTALGPNLTPEYIQQAVRASLERLGRDVIDVYQLHTFPLNDHEVDAIVDVFEDLVSEGLIRWYGVSNDDPAQIARFAQGEHCTLAQIQLNVLDDNAAALQACADHDLGVLCRSPLAMGLLGGRYSEATKIPANDIRGRQPEWLKWFTDGVPSPSYAAQLNAVREFLMSGGRTLAQGALGWIWARSDVAVPLPGFRDETQVRDNLGAFAHGPLEPAVFADIEAALGRGASAF